MRERRRLQGHAPGITLVAAVAATLAGCGAGAATPAGPEYLGVCVNQATGLRAPDALCNGLGGSYVEDWVDTWAYPSFIMPAYGSRLDVTHVTVVHVLPRGVTSSRTVPRLGGAAAAIRTGLSRTSGGGVAAPAAPARPAPNPTIQRGGFGVPSGGASSDSQVSRAQASRTAGS